jgi:hypothetical protein
MPLFPPVITVTLPLSASRVTSGSVAKSSGDVIQ